MAANKAMVRTKVLMVLGIVVVVDGGGEGRGGVSKMWLGNEEGEEWKVG